MEESCVYIYRESSSTLISFIHLLHTVLVLLHTSILYLSLQTSYSFSLPPGNFIKPILFYCSIDYLLLRRWSCARSSIISCVNSIRESFLSSDVFPDARTFHNIYKLQKHVLLRHQSYLIVFMGNKNLRFWQIIPL
jgi:hypothetical protein